MKQESITIISKRMKKKIRIADILYIIKSEYLSLIHLIDGDILQTITPIYELKEMLGDDCIEVKKGCIVSVSAITNIKDKIYLCNGEAIDFTVRRRKAVRLKWREKQKLMIDEINGQNPPRTDEEYHKYYEICDKFPFAFTDIEMVFNEKRHAVDWIFRYGNEALAELEGVPLKEMIGSTFQDCMQTCSTTMNRPVNWNLSVPDRLMRMEIRNLKFTHASDYTIVIDVAVMDGGNKDSIDTTKDNGNAEDNKTIPASNADHAKSDAWNPAIIIIIGSCILLIVSGVVIFARKKSGSEEE